MNSYDKFMCIYLKATQHMVTIQFNALFLSIIISSKRLTNRPHYIIQNKETCQYKESLGLHCYNVPESGFDY